MKENSVLIVDDDINVLSALKRGLIDEDYKCFFAVGGDKALAIMEENEISVIISDMRMPGMDGLQLLKIIKEKYPLTVKIVLTGYTQLPQILATINQVDVFKFITKPWNLEEELKVIIRQAVEYYNFQREKEIMKNILEKRNTVYQNILKSTEEKFMSSRRDFENIKEINRYIFKILREQVISDSKEAADTIHTIESIYYEYLNTIPTNNVDFEPKKLEIDLKSWLNDKNFNEQVNIGSCTYCSGKARGNYNLILYVATLLLKSLIPLVEAKGLKMLIDYKDDGLIILFSINQIKHSLKTTYKQSIANNISISFLKVICNVVGYEVAIQWIGENPSIKLKIPA